MGRKWIRGGSTSAPVAKIARRALEERFAGVWHFLPRAAQGDKNRVENVHQLRVATRRAVAALHIFEAWLPPRRAKQMRKEMRRLRKAAGDARDLDVLIQRLRSAEAEAGNRALKRIIKRLKARRKEAQRPLRKAYKRARRVQLRKTARQLTKRVRRPKQPHVDTFGDFARQRMRTTTDDFFAAAEADLSDIDALHQMRIQGKHLRYTIEIFAAAFDESFRGELYPVFAEVQEKLGEINDHATAQMLLRQWCERRDDTPQQRKCEELLNAESERMAVSADKFRAWWTPSRQVNLHERFENYLARGDERPPATRRESLAPPGKLRRLGKTASPQLVTN